MKIWNIHFYKSPVGTREVTVVPAVKNIYFLAYLFDFNQKFLCTAPLLFILNVLTTLQLSKLEVLEDIIEVRWSIEGKNN